MKIFTNEVKIALVAIVGIVVLFFGLNFLKGMSMFSTDNTYYIKFHDISGLSSSNPIYADGYQEKFEKGEPQKQLSKEFVRQWLIENGFMGKEGQQVPEMTDEYCETVSQRYIELYEDITGKKFVPCADEDLAARIEKNVSEYLKTL